MIQTPAALFYVLTLVPALVPAADPFSGAIEQLHFSFEASEDLDFDGQPDDWTRRTGASFPPYIQAVIDLDHGHDGRQSLTFRANGGPAALYSAPAPIDALHSYVFHARIRTSKLDRDAAIVSVSLINHNRQRVQRFLTQPVVGTHNDWVRVDIGPITPHRDVRFVVIGCHLAPGARADVVGQAWFDDLWFGRLPKLALDSNFLAQFAQNAAGMRIEARASGLDAGFVYRLDMEMIDSNDRVLESASFPLDADPPAVAEGERDTPAVREPSVWSLPPRDYGFYRVSARLFRDDAVILERQTTLAVMELVAPTSRGEFGWSMPHGSGDIPPQKLAEIAAQAGINWNKYPLWNSALRKPETDARIVAMLDAFVQHGVTVVGLLNTPPLELRSKFARDWTGLSEVFSMPPRLWTPSIDQVMARHSTVVRHWQLGDDDDPSFVGLSNLAEVLSGAKREFDRIGRNTSVGVHWTSDTPLPPANWLKKGFLSVTASPPADASETPPGTPPATIGGPEQWAVIRPLSLSSHSAEECGADLVRRMVTARISDADAIFVHDVFDKETGLLYPDGSPTPLFLPWRTTATALRNTESLGSLILPNGSPNALFARPGEAVLVIWNPEPTTESVSLGDTTRVVATDIWGVQHRPTVDPQTGAQKLQVGPSPLVIRGCDEALMRWQMAVHFEIGRLQSATGQHQEAVIGRNTFPQGVVGEIVLRVPGDWEVQPRVQRFDLGPGEAFRLPIMLNLPAYATLGPEQIALDFEIDAEQRYRFRVLKPYQVGLGDVMVEVKDRILPDGRLEIEQFVINNTSPPEILNFECSLFIPQRKRQKSLVTKLGSGRSAKLYYLPGGESLRGRELWIRCEQVDGRRILNYRWTVGEEP